MILYVKYCTEVVYTRDGNTTHMNQMMKLYSNLKVF